MDYVIADAHADTLWATPREKRLWYERSDRGHTDLPRLIEAGVGLQVLALFSDPAFRHIGFTVKALDMLHAFNKGLQRVRRTGVPVDVVRESNDLTLTEKGLGIILSIEGGEALGGNIGVLHAMFHLGIRAVGLVWNEKNEIGQGAGHGSGGKGLTAFGIEVVQTMEQLGMLVDVSHLNDPGFADVIAHSNKPFYASHSNARSLCNVPRNLTDDQIRAIASRGGLIGINFHSPFLRKSGRANVDDVIAHIDYIASLVGIDYVCLGTDFDGIPVAPVGLEDVTRLPFLSTKLRQVGYAPDDVKKVMGQNLLRLFSTILPSTS